MLLYCTREEAIDILTAAKKDFHLTGENYVWVVTQSVIENPLQAPYQFPVGMLGESGYDNCTAHSDVVVLRRVLLLASRALGIVQQFNYLQALALNAININH